MTDTYNDTTGSRKKFLIPLVVLLLCAVSLTGAGYAYNTSVSVDDGSAGMDETFVIDLYETDKSTIIKSNTQVNTATVDGLVFVTSKSVANPSSAPTTSMFGNFAKEKMQVDLYTGDLLISQANLARGGSPTTTTTAYLTVDSATAEFKDGATYALEDTPAPAIAVSVKIYDYADTSTALTPTEGKYTLTIGTHYMYKVVVDSITGKVLADDYDSDVAATYDAAVFAAAVAADIDILFDFQFTAEAIEA